MPPRSIAVLLEGDGDYDSVPLLVRNIAAFQQYYDLVVGTKPIKVGDAHSIRKSEKFLRLFEYAISRDDIDAVLIATDCEDFCPVEVVKDVYERTKEIVDRIKKPVGITLFCREYETMFLVNANHIAPRCQSVTLDPTKLPAGVDFLNVRNAKGILKTTIATNTYKETRDQPRLTGAMDVGTCAASYRPLGHLVNVINWIYAWDGSRYRY